MGSVSNSPYNNPSEPPQRRHVVLFPFMSKGHTIPLLHLCRLLLARNLDVTVFTTPANRPFIDQFLCSTTASVVDIPFPQNIHPEIPAGVESTDKLSSVTERLFNPFALATKHMQDDFEKALSSLPRVSFMVSDSFLWWTLDSATKFGFPRLAFYGFNNYAGCVSRAAAVDHLLQGVESDNELITLPRFPWIKVTKQDFDSSFTNPSPEGSEFFMTMIVAVMNSFGLVTNSFYELEPAFVDYWNTECGPKSWNVGPLCQLKAKPEHRHPKPVWIEWLDKKKIEGSRVLYVAFGTQAVISSEQVQEIAKALEKSELNFLWVIRKKESFSTWWDSEFEERVKGRGMVVSEWVDQTEILNHESVDGFLSHCGWNSAMEAICAGVPILAWAMMAEQPLNARMVAEEIKVGLRVETCDGSVRGFVKAEGLEKMVKKLMEEEEGEVVRKTVKEFSEAARRAVEEGGSSWQTLQSLIDEACSKEM
ncbi:UDP-glycosyltransferase 90A1-like [Argentina anserina]|uniref:UDP-glycosyltransferase 90A1-like n=1 Tax=Argentina anserina TaxID=57926 RepID=UPI0021769586|nr:UDP-glycosyltransferase 90A1-like [Potentilla anserina]